MNYISFVFTGFTALSLLIYYLVPKRARWIILLVSSISFYTLGSKYLIAALLLSCLSVFIGAKLIDRNNTYFKEKRRELVKEERKALKAKIKNKNKALLAVVIAINVLALAVFKYTGALTSALHSVFQSISVIKFTMPLGISYYTLMAVGYITDVYRGKYNAEKNYFKLLNFLIFFPHIVEGPIARYDRLSPQLSQGNEFNYDNFKAGFSCILWGLAKKLIIADRLAVFVNEVFENGSGFSGFAVVAAVILYTIQIYADFSGCIDIVSGISRMYGIRLDKNFDQPFFSTSVQEFWRRWHITLGAWLRDYIFYPVSLSKPVSGLSKRIKNPYLSYIATALTANFCVWFTMGIWHGTGFKYAFYGLYYFAVIALGVVFSPVIKKFHEKTNAESHKAYRTFQTVRTFLIVSIGMLFFRADSVSQAFRMIKSIFTFSTDFPEIQKLDLIISVVFIALMICVNTIKEKKGNAAFSKIITMPFILRWIIFIAGIVIILCAGIYGPGYNAGDFIYGGF